MEKGHLWWFMWFTRLASVALKTSRGRLDRPRLPTRRKVWASWAADAIPHGEEGGFLASQWNHKTNAAHSNSM